MTWLVFAYVNISYVPHCGYEHMYWLLSDLIVDFSWFLLWLYDGYKHGSVMYSRYFSFSRIDGLLNG